MRANPPAEPVQPCRVILRGRLVLPGDVVRDGVVVIEGERISHAGPFADLPHELAANAPPPGGDTLLPGLVDVHNHGGGGAGFAQARDEAEVMVAVREHRRHGTTSMLASLVTAAPDDLIERTALLAGLAEAGEIDGVHAEGPFLAHAYCGAQSPKHLVAGDPKLVRDLVDAGRGQLRTMTVAPEVAGVSGAGGVAETLLAQGVIASIGHTAATFSQTAAFIAALANAGAELNRSDQCSGGVTSAGGASGRVMTATHLFNAMPPIHHRDPGPVTACLAAARAGSLVAELVADGVHLAPELVRSLFELVGPDALVLVSDAMAATGMPDGDYDLGPMPVRVRDGVARLNSGDQIGPVAGGTAHLLDVVRRTVVAGVPLSDAVRSASWVPANLLGRNDIGALVTGRRADVVVTDDDLRVRRVFRAGTDVGP